jgi:nucleotide-binding universal stress UspA family protein
MICAVGGRDGSGSAVPVARSLSRRLGLRLELLHVGARWDRAERGDVRRHAALPADAELHLDIGPVADRLVEAADAAELLVIGAGRIGRVRRALGRGTAAAVARSSPVPVLIVPPTPPLQAPIPAGAIVCGIGGREDIGPARVAARLAQRLHASLTLAHMPALPAPAVPGTDPGPLTMPGTAMDALGEAVPQLFADVEAALPPGPPAVHELRVPGRSRGQELARVAAAANAALIVVGAPRHGPLAGAFTGSAVWELLGRAPAPLIVCPRRRP